MHPTTASVCLGILVCLTPIASRAQESPIGRGSVQIAGTARFVRIRDIGNDRAWTVAEIAPRVGYFILPGLAVNANLQFQRIAASDNHTTSWGVGPGLTYYVNLHSRRFYPFLSGRTLFTWDHTGPDALTGIGVKETNHVWLASAGALFMLVRHVGITGEVFYQHEAFTFRAGTAPKLANSSETYGLQWGIAAFIF